MPNITRNRHAVRSWIERHDLVIVILLSVIHIGLACTQIRKSGALN
jgi:hypothetical protein